MTVRLGYDGKFLWGGKSFGSRSGMGLHARKLLSGMLECETREQFRVYALDPEIGIDPPGNCEIVHLPRFARNAYFRNAIAYPYELQRRPVDVLMSFTTLPARAPCRTILLLPDVFWLANPGWLPWHIAWPRTLAVRSSVRKADCVITTTEFSRREIMRLLHVPAEKIVVAPEGVRDEFAERMPEEAIRAVRAQHRLEKPYILSVNDIHPRKNLEGLIEAFDRLKRRTGLPQQLVIAGRKLWSYPQFYQKVRSSAYADDIKVLGYVPSEHLLGLYQGADVFAYPSFYEGWGLQVHEAMMAGVPVTVADNTTMPEIAGDAADSFDPYNVDDMSRSLERILSDKSWSNTLVERGRERVKLYSWRDAAQRTLAVCKKVANS